MGETLNVHVDRFALLALVNLVAHIDTTFKPVELNGQCKKNWKRWDLANLAFGKWWKYTLKYMGSGPMNHAVSNGSQLLSEVLTIQISMLAE